MGFYHWLLQLNKVAFFLDCFLHQSYRFCFQWKSSPKFSFSASQKITKLLLMQERKKISRNIFVTHCVQLQNELVNLQNQCSYFEFQNCCLAFLRRPLLDLKNKYALVKMMSFYLNFHKHSQFTKMNGAGDLQKNDNSFSIEFKSRFS